MNKRGSLTIAALLFLFVLGLVFGPLLRKASRNARTSYLSGQSVATLERRNQGAFARILGEVRATASDFMFVKANSYLHVGVQYAKGIRTDALDQQAELDGCVAGTPTAIRTAAEDFRGFLGEIERTVKPYRDPHLAHIHTTQSEVLPWYRVMTLTNPHFVRGYRSGAHALTQQGRNEEALEFLQEGLANNEDNPEQFLLYQSVAFLYLRGRFREDLPWSGEWLELALPAARKAYEMGRLHRPADGVLNETSTFKLMATGIAWNADHEEDFSMSAGLLLSLLAARYEQSGNVEDLLSAEKYGREMHAMMPQLGPIRRSLEEIEALLEAAGLGRTDQGRAAVNQGGIGQADGSHR